MSKNYKISIGGDHAGYDYKVAIIQMLEEQGHTISDKGPFSNDSVDYPDFVHPVANDIENEDADFGILICGSANGVAITANKHQKVRAGIAWEAELAKLTREHNNANAIAIPARFISLEEAKAIVNTFLTTEFEGGRHTRRVEKISC